eukprot:jgi/Botrbrau1/15113/Bobra.0303s0006.1
MAYRLPVKTNYDCSKDVAVQQWLEISIGHYIVCDVLLHQSISWSLELQMSNWTDPFNQPWIKKVGVMDASQHLHDGCTSWYLSTTRLDNHSQYSLKLWQALCTWPPGFAVSADLWYKFGRGTHICAVLTGADMYS